MSENVIVDFTFWLKRLKIENADFNKEYKIQWKRGRDGSGECKWKRITTIKDRKTDEMITVSQLDVTERLSGITLSRKDGRSESGSKPKTLELRVCERNIDDPDSETLIKTVQWKLEYSDKEEGKRRHGNIDLSKGSSKLTLLAVYSVCMHLEASNSELGNSGTNRKTREISSVSDLESDHVGDHTLLSKNTIDNYNGCGSIQDQNMTQDSGQVPNLNHNVLELYTRIHSQESQLQDRRNEVRELRRSYETLKDDYESMKCELDRQDMLNYKLSQQLHTRRVRDRALVHNEQSNRLREEELRHQNRSCNTCLIS